MLIDDWVVVEIHGNWPAVLPSDVVIGGVLPPLIEGAVVISSVELVMQPQTEASAAQSIGPDFGVFAVHADRTVPPLVGQMGGDLRIGPSERVLSVPDHLEWLVPLLVVGDVAV